MSTLLLKVLLLYRYPPYCLICCSCNNIHQTAKKCCFCCLCFNTHPILLNILLLHIYPPYYSTPVLISYAGEPPEIVNPLTI